MNTNASNLSRRNFLKLSGVFGASAALFAVTGCGSDG
ncbi:MAG: twin-arginine translocation signal domain-containing protein, partial [Slackia sp.]|nr:twin-arginine translocation signal domain-containing protein [Slackia sp.]